MHFDPSRRGQAIFQRTVAFITAEAALHRNVPFVAACTVNDQIMGNPEQPVEEILMLEFMDVFQGAEPGFLEDFVG